MATALSPMGATSMKLYVSGKVSSHSSSCRCRGCAGSLAAQLSAVGTVARHGASCKCAVCKPSVRHAASCKCGACLKKACGCSGLCSHAGSHGWSESGMWQSLGKSHQLSRRPLTGAGGRRARVRAEGGKSPLTTALLDIAEVDRAKFEGMPYRRSVFTFDDWKKHKSSGRYVRHIQSIVSSRVIGSLVPPVVAMTGIALSVCSINTLIMQASLPVVLPLLHVNALPFSLTSPALSFLLVFRTNASYGRFDEARKMWGLMLNRTRDITRQALTYMARGEYENERPKMLQFIRHLQAFSITYKHHMVQEGDLEYDLKTLTSLTEEEIKACVSTTHRPNYILQMCSELIGRCTFDSVQKLSMDNNLQTFADDIGGSERIFKTPIPLSYTRLTSRFLVLWHLFLPLALWDSCGWLTVPITAIITAVLFCVEEVGVLIEEPFSILALSVISTSARTNAQELLNVHEGIKARVVPNEGEEVVVVEEIAAESSNGASKTAVPFISSQNGTAIVTEAPRWSKT